MEGVFTAGDGDLAIVYQSGAHVWGAWNVNYSEGIEPEDFEADRSLGYVGDTGDAGAELAARMWIRSDVSIDQDSQSSTLPAVFRDARERMSGDVVVERTISGPGLGGLVPYVDFHHGDEIGTVIGTKVVPLPVNGIEFSTDPDGGQDYSVDVGKGLLGNKEERDLRNAQLEAQIFKEIAERKREQARLAEQQERDRDLARQAKDAATTANSAAATADSAARAAGINATTALNLGRRLDTNEGYLYSWTDNATTKLNVIDDMPDAISNITNALAHMRDALGHMNDGIKAAQRGNNVNSDISQAEADITLSYNDEYSAALVWSSIKSKLFRINNPSRQN